MKKTLRRMLVIALAALMVLSVSACGKKDNGKVTLRIPIYQRATPNGAADAANNYWTKWVQTEFGDKYGYNVEYVALTRGEENAAYANYAADGNLPVVCFEYDYPDAALYYNEGYFQTYDVDWFKSIAPTYWKNMVDNGLDNYTKINGDNVLLIGTRAYGNTNYQFVTFYRLDWVEAAGYTEYPNDPDEELKMLKKIKSLGLGGDHLLGGTQTSKDNGVDQNYPYRTYPQDGLTRAQQGDYSIPALTLEAQKKLLARQNLLFNEGFIDDEYTQRESTFAVSDFVNGDVIAYSCYATQKVEVLDQFYAANPGAKLGIRVNNGPETFADGTNTAFRPNGIFGEYIGFSKDATKEQMEGFAKDLEWMSQPETLFTLQYGIEGVTFEYDAAGKPQYLDQAGKAEQQGHNNNVDMWCLVAATKTSGSVDEDILAITPQGYPDSDAFFKMIKANYEGQVACYNAGMCAVDPRFAEPVQAEADNKATLTAKYAELRDKIVTGSVADFEKNYKAACEEYLAAGYQKVIDGRTDAYNAGKVD